MEAKHTPGPWVQFADQGKVVAIMPAGRPGDVCAFSASPSDADANLIAAAPDMLALLKAMHETVYEQPVGAWFGAIRAAIAKAERA